MTAEGAALLQCQGAFVFFGQVATPCTLQGHIFRPASGHLLHEVELEILLCCL